MQDKGFEYYSIGREPVKSMDKKGNFEHTVNEESSNIENI